MTELKSFDRVAQIYDETRGLPPEIHAQVADAIAARLREDTADPLVIEIGIGTGRIAVPLAACGVRVCGTDISPKMVALLREKRRDIDAVFADAALPPFRERAFDAAIFVHILHLVADQHATLRAAIPLLRPHGVFMLGFENYDGVRLQADDIMEDIGRDLNPAQTTGRDGQQENFAAFRSVAAEAGFAVEQRVVARWPASIRGREILEFNSKRLGSASWKIDDEMMREMLQRAEPRLLALFGDLDTPREFERTFGLLIASRATAGA